MRSRASDFVQREAPIIQRRLGKKLSESFIIDRQNFRNYKRRRLANFGDQILNLANPPEVFVVCAVLGNLQRRIVIDAFHLLLEWLFKLAKAGPWPGLF